MYILRIYLLVFLFIVVTEAKSELKKTGQINIYQKYDDGTYKKGIAFNFNRDSVKEIVVDNITELMWQDTVEVKDSLKKKNLTEAIEYCNRLVIDEYDDWRLPTINELKGLVDYSQKNISIHSIFKNIAPDRYWSLTPKHSSNSNYWWISFDFAEISTEEKSTLCYVRCVRK